MTNEETFREALEIYARMEKQVRKPCPGSHRMYSTMMIDDICPHCGRSEDGLGDDILVNEPDPIGDIARAALATSIQERGT